MKFVTPISTNFDELDAAEKITGIAAMLCKNPKRAEKFKRANSKLASMNEKRMRLPRIIIF